MELLPLAVVIFFLIMILNNDGDDPNTQGNNVIRREMQHMTDPGSGMGFMLLVILGVGVVLATANQTGGIDSYMTQQEQDDAAFGLMVILAMFAVLIFVGFKQGKG